MTTTNRLELLTTIGRQLLAMALTGSIDLERAESCTAGKFSTDDLRAAMKMLHGGGLLNYRGGKYIAA